MKERIDTVLMLFIRIYTTITVLGYIIVYFELTKIYLNERLYGLDNLTLALGNFFKFIAQLIFFERNYEVYEPKYFFLLPVVIILIAVIVRYLLSGKTYGK